MSKKHKKRKHKKHNGGEPELSVLRDVREAEAVQEHWHATDGLKARKPPADYKYVNELAHLQFELIKLQEWVRVNGLKVAILFEGRDAAGKGGAIKRITESLNPRICRVVALGTPTDRERGQWYFQRYVAQLPTKGEIVLFDRSWYNRRRRACHGLLHRGGVSGVPALLPAVRGHAGPLGHLPHQVLVLGQ